MIANNRSPKVVQVICFNFTNMRNSQVTTEDVLNWQADFSESSLHGNLNNFICKGITVECHSSEVQWNEIFNFP